MSEILYQVCFYPSDNRKTWSVYMNIDTDRLENVLGICTKCGEPLRITDYSELSERLRSYGRDEFCADIREVIERKYSRYKNNKDIVGQYFDYDDLTFSPQSLRTLDACERSHS